MLDIVNLSAGYRARTAVVHGATLSVAAGEAVGVIGRNGAGKTCLALTASGILNSQGGVISLDGVDLTRQGARERVAAGISLVPEGRLIFGQLTVRENLVVAAYGKNRALSGELLESVERIFPILRTRATRAAASLSGGEQQMLAIARALVQKPRAIVLDEPSLGLAPVAIEALVGVLQSILKEGVALLLMEQSRLILREVCSMVHLLEQGRILRALATAELDNEESLMEAYLG